MTSHHQHRARTVNPCYSDALNQNVNGRTRAAYNDYRRTEASGVGFRLAWELATVVSFDYARSSEGSLFYMELGHQF
ncbi:MAG TPA: hypothetical protein VFD66_01260 [Verrucomicrobiae bacterium]|nr:hypothetical protein [Verrucomicrobiae bacterium]